jgi:hypothetical protein
MSNSKDFDEFLIQLITLNYKLIKKEELTDKDKKMKKHLDLLIPVFNKNIEDDEDEFIDEEGDKDVKQIELNAINILKQFRDDNLLTYNYY